MYSLIAIHHFNDEIVKVLQSAVGVPGVSNEVIAQQVYDLIMAKWASDENSLKAVPVRNFEIVGTLNFIRRADLSWEQKIERIVGTEAKRYNDGLMAQTLRYYDNLNAL